MTQNDNTTDNVNECKENNDNTTTDNNNANDNNKKNKLITSKPNKKKSRLKARRLHARLNHNNGTNNNNNNNNNINNNTYNNHLRKTKIHNHKFKKMAQQIKLITNNNNNNASQNNLIPLSQNEIDFITNTVKSASNNASLLLSDNLGKEFDDGYIEFKWKLISPNIDRLEHLITQMIYRLGEGNGKCIYHIGVQDNGYPAGLDDYELIESIKTIYLIGKQCSNCAHSYINNNSIVSCNIEYIRRGINGNVAKLCVIRKSQISRTSSIDCSIRLCVIGNEDVGKSTLIGVLTRGKLDNGCGSVRINIFKHRHEIFDGRTSSISKHILGFDKNGIITNYKIFMKYNNDQIINKSAKIITFIDHPGHYKYFKTSLSGLISYKPHYIMLTVSLDEFNNKNKLKINNSEWTKMLSVNLNGLLDTNSLTSSDDDDPDADADDVDVDMDMSLMSVSDPQNIAIKSTESNDPSYEYNKYLTMCQSINIPLFIVITKCDIDINYNYLRLPKMLNKIRNLVRNISKNKLNIKLIKSSSEASRTARALSSASFTSSLMKYIPIFACSSVNGQGLDILKTFLFSLENSSKKYKISSSGVADGSGCNNGDVVFGIDEIYHVNNVGLIVCGILRAGCVHIGDKLYCGPYSNGDYKYVTIESIHIQRKESKYAFEGQMASFHLAEIINDCDIKLIRRGMVIISCNLRDNTCYSFEANINILNNNILRENSQPIIHIENVRQSAHILHLHSNTSHAVFTFLHYPEYIPIGSMVIIRKSNGPIAIGKVTKLLDSPHNPLVPLNTLNKPKRKRIEKHKTNRFKNYLKKWKQINDKNKSCSDLNEIFSTSDADADADADDNDNNDNQINDINHNQHPIRPITKNRKNKPKKSKKNSKKKKKKIIIWRSGLGYENIYPRL